MKILILGAGQVGRTAADHLSREEANEVTVVDVNEDTLRDVQAVHVAVHHRHLVRFFA